MTTTIRVPDHTFPVHIPLFDIPNLANNKVFSIFGGTQFESLVNHSGNGNGVVVGQLNVEPMGVRQFGMENYIRFSNLGALSPAGFTLIVAFRSPVSNLVSGLVNLWSQSTKNSDSLRRRIFVDGSAGGTGPLRAYSLPAPSGNGVNWEIEADKPYLISMVRAGNGATGNLRLHNADGSIITGNTFATQATPITYAADVALEVGNGSSETSGGSLLQGVGLWSGVMSSAAVSEAAAALAYASGVFD
ncbi:hypothetical protein [Pseudomonas sp. NPDC089396]|uniref:hypothetical protein n=1 Tax=Pseudomonas sp. NPDC089396 TaxID=3364461 RepID=UPI0038377FB1